MPCPGPGLPKPCRAVVGYSTPGVFPVFLTVLVWLLSAATHVRYCLHFDSVCRAGKDGAISVHVAVWLASCSCLNPLKR